MELKKLKELVIETLKELEFTRGNDDLLYMNVLIKINAKSHNSNLITEMSVSNFFTNRKRYGFPTYESVSRCRRKAQEENPKLRATEKVQESRRLKEEKFYNFATKQAEFNF